MFVANRSIISVHSSANASWREAVISAQSEVCHLPTMNNLLDLNVCTNEVSSVSKTGEINLSHKASI